MTFVISRAFLRSVAVAVGLSVATWSPAKAEIVEYSGGHGDVGLAFEGGELELHYHFGEGAILDGSELLTDAEFAPSEAYVRVPDSARQTVGAAVSFLGVGAGDDIWRLPAQNPGTNAIPYLGLAADELSVVDFSTASYRLTGFSGPGNFALWNSDGVGGTTVFMQSLDGIDGTDVYDLTVGGHDHANWGFTAEGVYDITITAFADGDAGSFSDVGTFRFVVGSATAVPEPGAFLALGVLASGVVVARRRKQRSAAEVNSVDQG